MEAAGGVEDVENVPRRRVTARACLVAVVRRPSLARIGARFGSSPISHLAAFQECMHAFASELFYDHLNGCPDAFIQYD